MKFLYSEIVILLILINFDLCLSGEISSKIDFGSDQKNGEPSLNPGALKAIIDGNRGFTQQQMSRGANFNGGHSSYRPQNGNFVRNDKSFSNRGQGNAGRINVNNKPVINYIRVIMNEQKPNPCDEDSCTLTFVNKRFGNGKILTDVYINMDESQIETEGEEAITIKVALISNSGNSKGRSSGNCPPNSQGSSGNCPEGPSNQSPFYNNPDQSIPQNGNPPPFLGNPRNFQPSPGVVQQQYLPFDRHPGHRFYPQRPQFSPGPPPINSEEIVDDKIGFPLSKTNNELSKS